MERLTKRRNGVCTYIGPRCMYPDTGETAAEMDFINTRTVLERLAAYEDTGLEPEEIKELCTDDVAEIAKLFRHMIEDGSIDHLQKLLEAEKDGRLVAIVGRCKDCAHWIPPHIENDGEFVRELKQGELVPLSEGINVGSYCSMVDAVFVHGFREGEPSSDKTMAWMGGDEFCSKFERKEADNG